MIKIWQEFFTRSAFMDLFIFNFSRRLILIIFKKFDIFVNS